MPKLGVSCSARAGASRGAKASSRLLVSHRRKRHLSRLLPHLNVTVRLPDVLLSELLSISRPDMDVLQRPLIPLLIGQDPLERERLWQQVRRMDRWWGFLPIYAHGPIDVALWDLGAKAAGLPLYRLLGAYRTKLPSSASSLIRPTTDAFVQQAKQYRDMGYTAYNFIPGAIQPAT